MFLKNGDEYQGEFIDGLFSGYNMYLWKNGDQYCGDFKNGKMSGNGVLRVKTSGLEYAGEFDDGKLVHG